MGKHDFDFLPGRWNGTNHKLVDGEWTTFEATSDAYAMLDGGGNHDHFRTAGYEGFSLRLYDPERRFVWSEITGDSARWEQSFSYDGGRTWEKNWVMELRRA